MPLLKKRWPLVLLVLVVIGVGTLFVAKPWRRQVEPTAQSVTPAPNASVAPSCLTLFRETCTWLKSQPVVLSPFSTPQLKVLNPTLNRDQYQGDNDRLLTYDNTNRDNLNQAILPMFNELNQLARAYVETYTIAPLPKQTLLERLGKLRLVVQDRERCQRANRPPVVGGSGDDEITICPLLTHQPIGQLLTLIAHEYGHIVDPCTLADYTSGRVNSGSYDCTKNDEIEADKVSLVLSTQYLERLQQTNPTATATLLPTTPRDRMLYLVNFRIDTNCDTKEGEDWAAVWLSSAALSRQIGCVPEAL